MKGDFEYKMFLEFAKGQGIENRFFKDWRNASSLTPDWKEEIYTTEQRKRVINDFIAQR